MGSSDNGSGKIHSDQVMIFGLPGQVQGGGTEDSGVRNDVLPGQR